ncbi:MAG: hypothetical protein WB609_00870 [Candidatus Cybelea sp.]
MLVTLRDLSPSSRREAVRFAAEVVRKTEHRGTAYIVDDDGLCHVRGEYGNLTRQAMEYTKAQVIALRCILRERGAKTVFEEAEALLAEALAVADGWYTVTVSTSAERMARKRAKAPPGVCVACAKRKARKGLRTCEECNAAAIERVRASRQKPMKKKPAPPRRK